MNIRKEVDASDVFIFLGLVLTGMGLFFSYGRGVALTVVGLLLFLMGFFAGAIRIKK